MTAADVLTVCRSRGVAVSLMAGGGIGLASDRSGAVTEALSRCVKAYSRQLAPLVEEYNRRELAADGYHVSPLNPAVRFDVRANTLLARLYALDIGVALHKDGPVLRLKGRDSRTTPELIAEVRAMKARLTAHLFPPAEHSSAREFHRSVGYKKWAQLVFRRPDGSEITPGCSYWQDWPYTGSPLPGVTGWRFCSDPTTDYGQNPHWRPLWGRWTDDGFIPFGESEPIRD